MTLSTPTNIRDVGEIVQDTDHIERRIVTGLIVSTNYLRRVRGFWKPDRLESPELRRIASWCWTHFEKYDRAPDTDIESIFMVQREANAIPKGELELIERILERASRDYGRGEQFSAAYLYDRTVDYFRHRELEAHTLKVQALLDKGRSEEAHRLQQNFQPSNYALSGGVLFGSELSLQMYDEIFSKETQRVLHFPGALGEIVNEHLVRSGFVAFLAPEKRGKTWLLLEFAVRALQHDRSNVAFFTAGDMTEKQVLTRLAIHLTRRNMQEKYCEEHYRPVGDCILNQIDKCNRKDRECDFGLYDDDDLAAWGGFRESHESYDNLVALAKKHPDYRPCTSKICKNRYGTVWMQKERERVPLTADAAKKAASSFLSKCKRQLRVKAYDTGTLTPSEMRSQLDTWEKEDDFVPDLVITDYADIMTGDTQEFRHRQNEIWMGLRALSLNRDCLVVTVTQADAASYSSNKLQLKNFSEDKRKYSHVTAMWSLNQTSDGREKKLGIMRIGELLVREGEFNPENEVAILQDLWIGRPYLGSYPIRKVNGKGEGDHT